MARRSFIQSAGIISLFTLISRVLGLVRDHLCARMFGTGTVWDAFVIAFTLPNLFRRLFGEGALSAAFIPVFSRYLERGERKEAWDMISAVATALALLLAVIVIVGIIFASFIPSLGISDDIQIDRLEATLIKILLPYTFLICLAALLMAVLNTLGHFTVPALAQVVLNVCWIGGAVLLAPQMGETPAEQVVGIALAIILGGMIQLFMQAPQVLRAGVQIRPYFNFRHPGLVEVGAKMLPIVLGLAPTQLNIVADRLIAKLMAGDGANSVLFFSNRLMQFPLALIGIAMATAAFPLFSRYSARNMTTALREAFHKALRITLFLSIPASIGLVVLREPIVNLFFNYDQFAQGNGLERTAECLLYYAVGIWAFCIQQIVVRAFYATGNTRVPVRVSIAAVALNLTLNILLVGPLGAAGLALATSLTGTVQVLVLIGLMEKQIGAAFDERLVASIIKTLGIACVMGLVAFGVRLLIDTGSDTTGARVALVFVPLVVSIGLFFGCAKLLRMTEVDEIFSFKRQRDADDSSP